MQRKYLILECAGLDMHSIEISSGLRGIGLNFMPLVPLFPAVTCPAQATIRTALPPSKHGIIANGRYDRRMQKVDFWNQSAALYSGTRIWETPRANGRKVAVMFMQQSLGDDIDYCLSPAPVHKHHGGMIMACHTKPASLEAELTDFVGCRFKLDRYWGPRASKYASLWCAKSTIAMMCSHSPDILFSYLPHMDYCLQREGPSGASIPSEADFLAHCLEEILRTAKERGYEVLVWGDYAITEAHTALFPNRILRNAGFFNPREIEGMLYPNLYDSKAFAMVDHQIAHIFVKNNSDIPAVHSIFAEFSGIDKIETPKEAGLNHPECGELILTAAPGVWFAYPWWETPQEAPDYATHVDIHNKIGFDPCELFWKIPFISTCQDTSRIHGTHGRVDTPAAFAVTDGLSELASSYNMLKLSENLKKILEK